MAKKIKKRSKRRDEEPQEADIEEVDADDDEGNFNEKGEAQGLANALIDVPENERDAFEDSTIRALNWIERNREAFFGLAVLAFIAPFAIYMGVLFLENSAIDASSEFNPSMEAYRQFVADGPELENYGKGKALEKHTKPTKTFATPKDKWQALYDASAKVDKKVSKVATPAKLAQAAAANRLGKYDEAIHMYQDLQKDSAAASLDSFILFGLAQAQIGKGDVDGAVQTLDLLAKSKDYAPLALYHKGHVYESTGQKAKAKEAYHKLVETYPESDLKAEVDRRLAMM